MKRLLLSIALILSVGLPVMAIAQESDATPDLYAGVEGIDSSYARFISVMPETMPIINMLGMSFDSDENAQLFYGDLLEQMQTEIDESELPPGAAVEYTETEVDDNIRINRLTALGCEDGYAMVYDFILDTDTLFTVFVVASSDEEALSLADTFTQFILESDIETEAISFNENGTSTGGVFDRMPTADDKIVPDGAEIVDYEEISAGEGISRRFLHEVI